ncbi:methyl-accepting chemotaxis protein [Nisaea sp.]|uniref:methyl-accepting chemotaxis protein n=1 Tax=Nisaea sp. TaxID=2024842 RepID=UPI0032EEC0ED
MSSLTLRTKLMALLLSALLAVVAIGGVTIVGIEHLRKSGSDIYERAFVDMGMLSELQLTFERQRGLVSRAPAELDLDRLSEQLSEFDQLTASLQTRIEDYQAMDQDSALSQGVQGLAVKLNVYHEVSAEVYASAESFDSENAIALVAGPVSEAAAAVSADLATLARTTEGIARGTVETMQADSGLIQQGMAGVAALLLIVLGGGGYWFISFGVSRPITDLAATMDELANGNREVEIPSLGRHDEIGAMSAAVQIFKKNAIENERLQKHAKEQEQRVDQDRRQALNDLAGTFESSVASVIDDILVQINELGAKGQIVTEASDRTKTDAGFVLDRSDQTSNNVATIATAVEQLSASIREISVQTSSAQEMTSSSARDAQKAMGEATTLAKATEEVGGIIQLINDIAEQTNLLALNATIEAARAGNAGKGFAVVASEVKSLANQTAQATEEISSKISSIQNVAESMARIIGAVDSGMSSMDEIASGIAVAVEEQGSATDEISQNIAQAADGTKEVSQSMAQVDSCARDTGSAVAGMVEINQHLADRAQQLKAETERFLASVRQETA